MVMGRLQPTQSFKSSTQINNTLGISPFPFPGSVKNLEHPESTIDAAPAPIVLRKSRRFKILSILNSIKTHCFIEFSTIFCYQFLPFNLWSMDRVVALHSEG